MKVVTTPYGVFTIPNYDRMSHVEIQRERNSYEMKFAQLKRDWEHVTDVVIEGPREGEHISNLAVRYMECEKHLLARTGSDLWFVCLVGLWGLIEWGASELGVPVHGYVLTQVKSYKMYKSQLTKMGQSSGFGQDWPPWMQVAITSAISAAVLAVISKLCPDKIEYAPKIMSFLSRSICGDTEIQMSEMGTPKPPDGSLAEMASSMVPENPAALMNQLTGGGGMSGIFGMLGGLFGGGDSDKKRSRKQKKKEKEARRKGPAEEF